MANLFNGLLTFSIEHFALACTAAVLVAAGTLTGYARMQIQASILWILNPLTDRLPWTKSGGRKTKGRFEIESCLTAELTIVELSLMTSDGKEAVYRKSSDYLVTCDELNAYKEAVTTVGSADGFHSSFGLITATVQEHGFFVSTIDAGNMLNRGARFASVFSAKLHNGFTARHEHWTQEIARPTDYLVMRVHFPRDRDPVLVRCKLVNGMIERQTDTAAKVVASRGKKSIVWTVAKPSLKDIYKLEWVW